MLPVRKNADVNLLRLSAIVAIGMVTACASGCGAKRVFTSTQDVVNYCATVAVQDALSNANKQGVLAATVRSDLIRTPLEKAIQSCAVKHDVVCIPYQEDYQCEDSHFGDGLNAYGLESIGLEKAFAQLVPS